MICRELLIAPHTASMFVLLVFDYNLPLELIFGGIVVIPHKGHRHRSILRKVIVQVDGQYEKYLDAALVVLNIE